MIGIDNLVSETEDMDQMDHVKEDLFGFFIGKCLNVFLLFIVVLIFLIMSKHAAGEFSFGNNTAIILMTH